MQYGPLNIPGDYYFELVDDGMRNWQNFSRIFPIFYGISYPNFTYYQASLNDDGSCKETFLEFVFCSGWNSSDDGNSFMNDCDIYRYEERPPIYGLMELSLIMQNSIPSQYNSKVYMNVGVGENQTSSSVELDLTVTNWASPSPTFPYVSCQLSD